MEFSRVGNLEYQQFSALKKSLAYSSLDGSVKSPKTPIFAIPANPGSWSGARAGIHFFQFVTEFLDSGLHRSDDFLRIHQTFLH